MRYSPLDVYKFWFRKLHPASVIFPSCPLPVWISGQRVITHNRLFLLHTQNPFYSSRISIPVCSYISLAKVVRNVSISSLLLKTCVFSGCMASLVRFVTVTSFFSKSKCLSLLTSLHLFLFPALSSKPFLLVMLFFCYF